MERRSSNILINELVDMSTNAGLKVWPLPWRTLPVFHNQGLHMTMCFGYLFSLDYVFLVTSKAILLLAFKSSIKVSGYLDAVLLEHVGTSPISYKAKGVCGDCGVKSDSSHWIRLLNVANV